MGGGNNQLARLFSRACRHAADTLALFLMVSGTGEKLPMTRSSLGMFSAESNMLYGCQRLSS